VYDANLNIIKTNVTLANYKKTFAGTMFDNVNKRLSDIVNRDGKVKYNVLDEAVKLATEALKSAQTELEFNNGIIARDKNNPNLLVLFNSMGLGISTDGGNTFRQAITPQGIVTDLLTAGQINANNITVRGGDANNYSQIDSYGFYAKGTAFTLERLDGYQIINDGYLNINYGVQSHYPNYVESGIVQQGFWYTTTETSYKAIGYFNFKHDARYLKIVLYNRSDDASNTSAIRVENANDLGSYIGYAGK